MSLCPHIRERERPAWLTHTNHVVWPAPLLPQMTEEVWGGGGVELFTPVLLKGFLTGNITTRCGSCSSLDPEERTEIGQGCPAHHRRAAELPGGHLQSALQERKGAGIMDDTSHSKRSVFCSLKANTERLRRSFSMQNRPSDY